MRSKMIVSCALALGITLSAVAQSSKPAVTSLADFKTQLVALQSHVEATTAALNALKPASQNEADLAKAIAEFQNRLKAMAAQYDIVRTQAIVAKARAKEHYEAWQKSLATVEKTAIREKAQDRYTESMKACDKIVTQANEAKQEAVPFISEVKDIGVYLDADGTPEAVKTLSNTVWKLGNKAKSVNSKIGDVTEQIDRTIKSMPK